MAPLLAAVILCAGKGTRMKSAQAKVLHPLLGRPLFSYAVELAQSVGASPIVVVVGHQAAEVRAAVAAQGSSAPIRFAIQKEQRGTGHAVLCAQIELTQHRGPVLILYGDVPLLSAQTLHALRAAYARAKAPLALVATHREQPFGYGRLVRKGGRVARVVEERDCTPAQAKIREVNAGIYLVDSAFLWESLRQVKGHNAQGELYLTDVVERAARKGEVGVVNADVAETMGVNDRVELAEAGALLRARINGEHMRAGVTLVDPHSTFIAPDCEIAPDCVIGPSVSLSAVQLEAGVRVDQGCVLSRVRVGERTHLKPYSVAEDAVIGRECKVGPFAHLRPGTVLANQVHLGNFVETKKTRLGTGAKANHLSYLGDAEIGASVNIGAGTITCNYDGVHKHPTRIDAGAFIGSDTQLVAPVTVGAGAYVGAGTTVTQDVPAGSLALSRVPQVVKKNWAKKKGR